jgi:hypothetical protein
MEKSKPKKKKITQYKAKHKVKTPKDPTPRNKWRKAMKKISSSRILKFLRDRSAAGKSKSA